MSAAVRQQVNLYQPETAGAQGSFGALTLAVATGAVLLLMLLIGALGEWRIHGLAHAVTRLQQQQQAQQQTMQALGSLLPAGAGAADIHSQIQQLRAELAARERALALLRQGAIGRPLGFSDQLAALARCPVPGLWLQRIAISGVTGSMSLAGDALDPDSVPRYLRALAAQAPLAGLRFDQLVIARPAPSARSAPAAALAVPSGAYSFSAEGTPAGYAQVAAAQEPQS